MKLQLLILLFSSQIAFSQRNGPDSLDFYIKKEIADYKIPGLAIGIVKNGQVLFKKGYGYLSAVDTAKVNTATIFPIMSCTKAFTAAALGILVDEGKIDWNDKVIKYLPDFKLKDPWITKQLTISDILSHRSGLESFEGDLLWYGTRYSREEIIRRIAYSPLNNNFRIDFGYQNIMYLAAGMIIEKVTGKPWEEFIRQRFFIPLQMNRSTTSIKPIKDKNFALPHLTGEPAVPLDLDNIGPAGAINSTIDDMIAWLQLWIDNGAVDSGQLISKKSVEAMTSPKTFLSGNTEESYGFGWLIGYNKKRKVISHGGGLPGYKSLITIDAENKTGIIILTNKISYINEELSGILLEYCDSTQINWAQWDKSLLTKNVHYPWDDKVDTSAWLKSSIPDFQQYQGTFQDVQYGKVTLAKTGETARINFTPSRLGLTGYLHYIARDTLAIAFNDPFIPPGKVCFKRGDDKKVRSFILDVPPGDFIFTHFNFSKIK